MKQKLKDFLTKQLDKKYILHDNHMDFLVIPDDCTKKPRNIGYRIDRLYCIFNEYININYGDIANESFIKQSINNWTNSSNSRLMDYAKYMDLKIKMIKNPIDIYSVIKER